LNKGKLGQIEKKENREKKKKTKDKREDCLIADFQYRFFSISIA